ncbi:6-phosphogluconolactonase [Thalassotalea insulae]|uniref:6-phosphogluconolactonase n=1 Tax=Thalassotalea insulae TaxID=2056778 RepID=A0ABQ6H076_9GAMM|nr:6-phosphogluconolactonase [Thalassotalea insulae]GLX80281.1 6-phosphogluconolactonase [Thalassotalea insulae]
MYQLNEFTQRSELDEALAENVAQLLIQAVKQKGKASIAVSGGSTPKGFFNALSQKDLPWQDITITLADERWVGIDSDDSNTRLVHENLLQNKAVNAKFFHLKQGDELTDETLADLNLAAKSSILPLDVLILGMGEDGHTASLFPCSEQIAQALSSSTAPLLKVVPQTAPYQRITFSFAYLKQSKNTFLHISGTNKHAVLEQAIAGNDSRAMPIRAFLQDPAIDTQVYWAE